MGAAWRTIAHYRQAMKILMLGWELPPHNSGGLGVACYHLSKALAQEGASIDFVVPYSAKHENIDFMNIHAATKLSPLHKFGVGAYDHSFDIVSEPGSEVNDAKNIRGIQRHYVKYIERLVKKKRFDAIHAHDWLTMEAGIRAKQMTDAPLIVHVHATEFDRAGGNKGNPLIHEIEYQGLMIADRIVAVSDITRRIIIEKYGIPADKVEVIHNAIDVTSFDDGYEYDRRTYRYLEGLHGEGYTIISSVTRFTIQKGLEYLVRAFAKASEKNDRIALLLVGDGEQRDQLISLASELNISDKIFFTGFVRGKQWRDAYSVSDVFVLSSVSEPFGLAALEAAHHKTALILTKQSGVGEVLSNIFRYDFWDIDRLADQIVGIATSDALCSSLKDNVSSEYAKLSWQDVAKKCMAMYQKPRIGVFA
ncbi:MAG: glycosyltransferase family 1 protein [Candidatus Microsaccharimonas sossegonensis]|uniref:Glycosyltransferase family 1 protein n=1 Tax=Candidatus Microsaccharimonas sossegonensis TaxID=2506948 RepID=A0A4Q0AI93_9BACT|nr:MAG: glycosyltransferase family 1 protein [Candidatus Microsaccharimonas sossegonensis]